MLSARPRSLRHLLGLLMLALALPMLVLAVAVAVQQVRAERHRMEDRAREDARLLLHMAERVVTDGLTVLGALPPSAADPDLPAAMDRLRAASGRHVALLDTAGAVLRDTRAEPLGPSARAAAVALAAAGGLVSPLVEDPASGGHALLLAEPVAGGILVLALPGAAFQALLGPAGPRSFDATRFPALVDTEGRIVARWAEPERHVGQPMPGGARAAVLAAPEGTWRGENLAGERVVVAHAASSLGGLAVGVGITEAALAEPLRRSLLLLGPAVLLLLGLAALATTVVARRIGGSMTDLGLAATALAEGRPPPRLATPVAEVNAVAAAMAGAAERRLAAEAQRDLLVRELHHRVKNLLTTAQSLATLSARSARDPMGFALQFGERLRALARTHTMLLEEPGGEVGLAALLEEVVAPYRLGLGRIAIAGPPVRLPGDAAVPLGMVLHEMATNAAKYGALSVPEGRLDIAWEVEPGRRPRLRLSWTERGGPRLAGPPDRQGFGSQLLRRAMAGLPGGKAELAWREEGLAVSLALSLPAGPAATA